MRTTYAVSPQIHAQAQAMRQATTILRPSAPMAPLGPSYAMASPMEPAAADETPIAYYVLGAVAVAGVGWLVMRKLGKKSRKGRR